MPIARFSSTVIGSKSEKCWNTMPMPSWRAARGILDAHQLAFEADLAGIRREHAVDDLHQGRFAGTVLADQRLDLALARLRLTASFARTSPKRLVIPESSSRAFVSAKSCP